MMWNMAQMVIIEEMTTKINSGCNEMELNLRCHMEGGPQCAACTG